MLCKREGEVCTVLECLDKDILVQVGLTVDFSNLPEPQAMFDIHYSR